MTQVFLSKTIIQKNPYFTMQRHSTTYFAHVPVIFDKLIIWTLLQMVLDRIYSIKPKILFAYTQLK